MREKLVSVSEASRVLRDGGLVVFPTETVYGLGANALDARAVERVFETKGRPADNPLIVHVDSVGRVSSVAAEIDPVSLRLLAEFAPGPITVVLPARHDLPRIVTAGLSTVAVRVPEHPLAHRILAEAAVPVAAPSANRSGQPSPTTVDMAMASLGDGPDAYVDGGPCDVGLESTVVAVAGHEVRILRPGAVSESDILAALPDTLVSAAVGAADDPGSVASPGTRHVHYRPAAAVVLWSTAAQLTRILAGAEEVRSLAVIVPVSDVRLTRGAVASVRQVFTYRDACEYARKLYGWFHEADDSGIDCIVAHVPPESGIGVAVRDRLRRASGS